MALKFWRENFYVLFPFPAIVFPKNREIPGNSREVIFGNSQTGTTLTVSQKFLNFMENFLMVFTFKNTKIVVFQKKY